MRHLGRVLGATLVLLAVLASPAAATRTLAPPGQLVGFWNGEVVVQRGPDAARSEYVAVGLTETGFNGAERTLAPAPSGTPDRTLFLAHFSVWSHFGYFGDSEQTDSDGLVSFSPLPTTAAPTTLSECGRTSFGGSVGSPAAIAADADVVAWSQTRSCGRTPTIHVRDLASALPATTLRAPKPVTGLALAGQTLGYTTAATAGVLDRVTRAVLYPLSVPRGLEPRSLAVAPDGTAVLLLHRNRDRTRCGLELWVFSAAAPTGARRARDVCDVGPRWVGDSALVVAEDAAHPSVLERLDPAGAVVPLAFIEPATEPADLIADDTQVAYAQRTSCTGPPITFVDSVMSPDPAGLTRPDCPVVLSGVRLTAKGDKRTLRATLTCPAGCAGRYGWSYPQNGGSIDVDAEVETGGTHDFSLAPAQSRTVRFTVRCTAPPRRHRIAFRARGTLGAAVSARRTFTCPAGSPKGEPVRPETGVPRAA